MIVNAKLNEICNLDIELYKCITDNIATDRVVLTNKSILHMAEHHPEAYNEVLIELKETIQNPDYIIDDDTHENTGLIVRKISNKEADEHTFIVLRICTDSQNGQFANSIISGWKISSKRLNSYLRNKHVLYKNEKLC